jgi:starch-binding outer membrane protein SusE/F
MILNKQNMKLNKLLPASVALLVVLSMGCKKTEFDKTVNGEALGDFRLSAPASNTVLRLNAATPASTVTINWTASAPGISIAPTYRFIAAVKGTGSLDSPLIEFPSNSAGSATSLTLTQKQIDDALAAKGIQPGVTTEFIWTIEANNGTTIRRSQDVFNLSITRMKDGATPFVLLGPASSTTPVAIDPGSTANFFLFNWTRSKPATGGPAVTYKVLFSLDGNFSNPLFTINPQAAPNDSTARITYKAMSDSLNAHGQTNLSVPTSLKWTVIATSGTWNQQADYVNDLVILREVRMYLPGGYQASTGNGNDWDPGTAPELIRDMRPGFANNMYYIYIYLPAGAQFKFTQGRSWDVNYGATGAGNDLAQNGSNLSVATAGVYRISVNRTALKFDIRVGRMGFVGSATTSGWNPGAVFPSAAMGFAAKNLFVGIHNFVPGGWKLIDNDQWNNGSGTVDETRSYGTPLPSGSTLEINGANFADITAASRQRVIWDGRDVNNTKYEMSPATEMRVVGDGMQGVNAWDPAASPQMTYMGSGIWSITLTLIANKDIKFLAGNAWGAFDYEDNSGGSQATGVPRSIRWEGGSNFRTPTVTGSYTITLNEYNQTVTIN